MDTKPHLFLNLILKWDEPVEIVKRCIDSVKDYVDGIYVALTYQDSEPTQDNDLVKLLESYGANLFYFKWIKDFAAARQFVMDNTPHGENCYIYWQDADDVLKNAKRLPEIFQLATAHKWAAVFLNYWYLVDLDEKGEVREILVEHKRERIVRNDNTFKWIGTLHETLIEQRTENVIKVWEKSFSDVIVVHLTSNERVGGNLDRNLEILEAQAQKEQHKDPRTIMYLAKAYFDKGKLSQNNPDQMKIFFDLALTLFNEYLSGEGQPGEPGYHEGSGWAEERANAWSYISEIVRLKGEYNVAIRALHNALIESPEFPNYYIDMAMILAMQGHLSKAKHWLQLATSVPMPDTTIVTTPRDIKARALEVDYNIALHEGKLEQAVEDSKILVSMFPDSKELQARLASAEAVLAANQAAQSVVYLGRYLENIGESEKITPLLQSIPKDLQQEKFASEMRHKFTPPRFWEKDEITILCGPGFEEWSPASIETGLGGSEEAVVYLSQELKKLGWKVTVFANPGSKAGDYNGVTYKQWYDLNIKDRFNVLILWRNIGAVDLKLYAKYTLVWMHDVPSNPDFTQERVSKVDKIAVLSEFHKSLLRFSQDGKFVTPADDKIFVSANGISPVSLNTKWERDPYHMIYASSPDRGLIYLLNNWSEIKEAVPEATLDIFYGFKVYDAIHANNPARMQWKNYILELMKQPGITFRGRVGHSELNKEYARSGIWAYPCSFEEISCISAMKAQACGAVPVVTNYAALKETARNGVRVDIDITMAEGQKEYVKALIDMLKDHKKQQDIRKGMMVWAQEYFLWSKVAENWDALFKSGLENKTTTLKIGGEK